MQQPPTDVPITHVPAHDWATWAEANNAVIIDVREPKEWLRGTLPGSERIPLANLPANIAEMDSSRAVLLVCATGVRSTAGAKWLTAMGFENAATLDGGVKALGLL